MASLRRAIEAAGWPTWARTYPSRHHDLRALGHEVAGWIRSEVGDGPIVGVTHSLGGILVRIMRDELPWRGVVMLAPPNAGSRVATRLHGNRLYGWVYGPAGVEVARSPVWPPPPSPFAVIAGTRGRSIGNPTSWATRTLGLLPGGVPSDGTLAVDETRLPGMAAFATVDASHTWIMNHPDTHRLVLRFLETEQF